jgi:hypothetical protein
MSAVPEPTSPCSEIAPFVDLRCDQPDAEAADIPNADSLTPADEEDYS